jgi:hypothetical protein
VREQFPPGRVEPIPAKDGYRTRTVLIDKRRVALREGQSIVRYRGAADFIYVRVDASDFLFLPVTAIPATGLSLSSRSKAAFLAYRNSFAALAATPVSSPRVAAAGPAADRADDSVAS